MKATLIAIAIAAAVLSFGDGGFGDAVGQVLFGAAHATGF